MVSSDLGPGLSVNPGIYETRDSGSECGEAVSEARVAGNFGPGKATPACPDGAEVARTLWN